MDMPLRPLDSDKCSYAEFIVAICKFCQYKTLVEVGIAAGDTTAKLCEAASATGGKVFAYDIFAPCPGYGLVLYTTSSIQERLEKSYPSTLFKITQVDTRSDDFGTLLKKDVDQIDFAFIDASHSYLGTKNDFMKVYPLLAEDGALAIHDTYSHNGSRRFVLDLYKELNDGTFEVVNFPYGGHSRRYGITLVVKRTHPLYPSGIFNLNHDSIPAGEIYEMEKALYLEQKKSQKN